VGGDIFADEKGGWAVILVNQILGGGLKLKQDKNKNKGKNKIICKNHPCPRSHK
jgi:hypothetical protein